VTLYSDVAGPCCLHLHAAWPSKMLVVSYHITTQHQDPEHCYMEHLILYDSSKA